MTLLPRFERQRPKRKKRGVPLVLVPGTKEKKKEEEKKEARE